MYKRRKDDAVLNIGSLRIKQQRKELWWTIPLYSTDILECQSKFPTKLWRWDESCWLSSSGRLRGPSQQPRARQLLSQTHLLRSPRISESMFPKYVFQECVFIILSEILNRHICHWTNISECPNIKRPWMRAQSCYHWSQIRSYPPQNT